MSMKYFLLLIIPLILLINVAHNHKTEFGTDPNFIYLFNGMNLASHGGPIGHYDNPGTPVIELSAIIMRITYIFRSTDDDFTSDVLKNPNFYNYIVVWTLVAINCLLIFLLGFFISKTTNEIIYGLLFQTIPFFSKYVFIWSFQTLSPEPVLFGTVIIFIILFLWKYYFNKSFGDYTIEYAENQKFTIDRFVILFAFLMGFCLATKINTVPLVLVPLLFIPGVKNKFYFLIISFVSFIIFTLPIFSLYRIMFSWYTNIITHTDLYGTGSEGFVESNLLLEHFALTLKDEPIILFIISISLLVLALQIIRKKFDNHFNILVRLVIVQLAYLFMVLKNFHLHYYIPLLPLLAVNLFIILQMFKTPKIIKCLLIIPFIAMCFLLSYRDFTYPVEPEYTSKEMSDGLNVYSYKSKSLIAAIKFGEDRSRNANSEKLKEIYGDQYFYDLSYKTISTWTQPVTIDSLFRISNKVYLHGLDEYLKEYPPPFKIKQVSEGIYLIDKQENDTLIAK
jgi:hypothetical protein